MWCRQVVCIFQNVCPCKFNVYYYVFSCLIVVLDCFQAFFASIFFSITICLKNGTKQLITIESFLRFETFKLMKVGLYSTSGSLIIHTRIIDFKSEYHSFRIINQIMVYPNTMEYISKY